MRLRAVRYFTDFIEGQDVSRDEEGLDFAERLEACRSAAEALVEAAHDLLRGKPKLPPPGGGAGLQLEAQVRDEAGSVVFRARLALDLEWQPAID
ncbi:hypothetical protein ABIE45_002861 [Methylobacterium sp. OAE515]|uniref:DUF6894 family protein n=1 Tax=Methylobacterium sp. OAE515 TaxID=2817895 RepID=UPI0019E0ABD7